MIDLRHVDCMEYLATCEDNAFELAIVDPPYGLGETNKKTKQRARAKTSKWKNRRPPKYGGNEEWDNATPEPHYFSEIKRVSKNQIIWGANHFGMMPPSSGWVVWYKKRFDEINDFSDAELAYTSFKKGCRLFHMAWIGFGAVNAKEKRIHTTQKPVKLYEWLLMNYAKEGDRILDTHLGSGSIAIACHNLGFDLVGCELDKEYFNAASTRLEKHKQQLRMF